MPSSQLFDNFRCGYGRPVGTPVQQVAFRVQMINSIIPRRSASQGNIENLQALRAYGNRLHGDRPHEYLVARLQELGTAL